MLTQIFLACDSFVLQAVIVSWYRNQIKYFSIIINWSLHFELFWVTALQHKKVLWGQGPFSCKHFKSIEYRGEKVAANFVFIFQIMTLRFFSSMYQTGSKSILSYEIQVLLWIIDKCSDICTSMWALEMQIKNLVSHISRFYLCT